MNPSTSAEPFSNHERLRGWALAGQQLRYMIWRHALAKRRSWGVTLVEILSPVVFLFTLVLAYRLVEIEIWPEHIYTNDSLYIVRRTSDLFVWRTEQTNVLNCSADVLRHLDLPSLGNIDFASLEAQVATWRNSSQQHGLPAGGGDVSNTPSPAVPPSASPSRPANGSSSVPLPPGLLDLRQRASEGLADALIGALREERTREEIRGCASKSLLGVLPESLVDFGNLWKDMKGPLPMLTFDEFVLLAKTLQRAADNVPGATAALESFKRDFGFDWLGNLVGLGGLAFTPATPDVLRFADHMSKSHAFFDEVFMGVFDDVAQLEKMAFDGHHFWAVVDFQSGPNRQTGVDYTIRMSFIETPETWIVIDDFHHWVSNRYKTYITSGFMSLLAAVNNYVLGNAPEMEGGLVVPRQGPLPAPMPGVDVNGSGIGPWVRANDTAPSQPQKYNLWLGVFPKAFYVSNKFYEAVGPLLGLLLCLSLIFPLAMLIRGIVEEKENKLREVLFIMGLRSSVLHVSWLLAYLVVFTAVSTLSTLVASNTFLGATSSSLLFTYLMVFSLSELAFGVMVSTLFSRAKVAAIVGPLMHFAFVMPRYIFFRTGSQQALSGKLAVSLLSPAAFTFGADLLCDYEGSGRGLQWSDLWSDPYPFGGAMAMMLVDTALYLLLAMYFDQVVPSGYGTTQPPWFLLTPSWWRGDGRQRHSEDDAEAQTEQELSTLLPAASPSSPTGPLRGTAPHITGEGLEGVEEGGGRDSGGSGPVVVLSHLHMRYPNGVVAVHDLDLQMYLGETTSLLGHNGAGKSTTVAMMTGLVMPTSGDCTVDGRSIVTDTLGARGSTGICPQQNVLFETLTVHEHLVLLAAIKGVPARLCQQEAMAMQSTIGLPQDGGTLSTNLSGGMKRKLQVGMALIGGSRLVVLDEPTSGLDPGARRALWSLLRAVKKNRALLLTTHYMDEADILSDKIGIMSAGRLCCAGSPLQLKARYGDGYTLTLTKEASAVAAGPGLLQSVVAGHVAGAVLVRHAAAEVVFRLPLHASATFPRLFAALEERAVELGVAHYGIAMPTMEEIFLRATDEAAHDKHTGPTSPSNGTAARPAAASGTAASQPANGTARPGAGSTGASASLQPVRTGAAGWSILPSGTHSRRDGYAKLDGSDPSLDVLPDGAHGADVYRTDTFEEMTESPAASRGPLPVSLAAIELGAVLQHKGRGLDQVAAGNGDSRTAGGDSGSEVFVKGRSLSSQGVLNDGQGGDANGNLGDSTPVSVSIVVDSRQPGEVAGRDVSAHSDHAGHTSSATADRKPGRLASSFGAAAAAAASSSNGHHTDHGDGSSGSSNHRGGNNGTSRRWADGEGGRSVGDVLRHVWRCFLQMVQKRHIITFRDWKGLLHLFLLPVVAVAFTLLILTVNVDPTGPSLILSMHSLEQYTPIPVARNPAPGILTGCLTPVAPPAKKVPHNWFQGWDPHYRKGTEMTCPGGLSLEDVNLQDSWSMSEQLLGDYYEGMEPQYGAIVFDDPSVRAFTPMSEVILANTTDELAARFKQRGGDASVLSTYIHVLSVIPNGWEATGVYASQKVGDDEVEQLLLWLLDSVGAGPNKNGTRHAAEGAAGASDGQQLGRRLMAVGDAPDATALVAAALPGISLQELEAAEQTATVAATLAASSANAAVKAVAKAARAAANANAPASSGGGGAGSDESVDSVLLERLGPALMALLASVEFSDLAKLVQEARKTQRVLTSMRERFLQPPVTVMWNGSSWHGMPAMVNDLHQGLANLQLAPNGAPMTKEQAAGLPPRNVLIRCTNHPLPLTDREHVTLDTFLTIFAALFVLVPFCYLSGAYAVSPVTETRSGAKALQLGSGCSRTAYWVGSFAYDLMTHLAVSVVSLATFAIFQDAATTGDWTSASGTFLLLLGYGAAVVPLSYCYSFGFDSPSTAQVSVSAINFALGFMLTVGSQVMANIPECQAFQRVAVHFARLLPPFNLGEGLINMSAYRLTKRVMDDAMAAAASGAKQRADLVPSKVLAALPRIPSTVFGWSVVGRSLAALYGEALLYLIIAIAIDTWRNDARWRNTLLGWTDVVLVPLSRWLSAAWSVMYACWYEEPHNFGSDTHSQRPMGGTSRTAAGQRDSVAERRERWGRRARRQSNLCPIKEDRSLRIAQGEEEEGRLLGDLRGAPSSDVADVENAMRAGGGTDNGAGSGDSDVAAVAAGSAGEDVDVAAERRRVAEASVAGSDAICIRNLRKVYSTRPPKTAVHDLCLGVPRGQRFGFLGANGAGKSTTLSVLSGQAVGTSGDVYVAGRSVSRQHDAAQRLVGYCPQIDPLLDLMTAREQLMLYCRLKGVPEEQVLGEVCDLITRCGLPERMANRPSGTLSGGNKRKVALSISLSGRPAAVLLDEPSSGMDPGARRMMWDAILRVTQPQQQQQRAGGQSGEDDGFLSVPHADVALVLTTHYMEECEALCERVGIMDKGRLVCLGSPQHLKSKFGGSYLLEVHGSESATVQARLLEVLQTEFSGGVHLEEQHFGHLKLRLPAAGLSLARVFQVMETIKDEQEVVAYSVSQPSLEQVFLEVVGHTITGDGDGQPSQQQT